MNPQCCCVRIRLLRSSAVLLVSIVFLLLQRDFHYYETFDFFGCEPCC